MTDLLPDYYRATTVPEALRSRQCRVCRAPVDKPHDLCYQCNKQPSARKHLTGFVTYAFKGRQSGTEMHGYKNQRSPQAVSNVSLLLNQGLSHMSCASRLVGSAVGAVAVVPSRSHYQPGTPSMLQRLCTRALPDGMPLVDLRPTPGSTSDRLVRNDAFEVVDPPDASHVMLIDDTWVSGATTLSAVKTLQASGAQQVSVLILARWLDPTYGPTNQFLTAMREHALHNPQDVWRNPQDVCPFTLDGSCPG